MKDIKPENILLEDSSDLRTVKLTDFGLAVRLKVLMANFLFGLAQVLFGITRGGSSCLMHRQEPSASWLRKSSKATSTASQVHFAEGVYLVRRGPAGQLGKYTFSHSVYFHRIITVDISGRLGVRGDYVHISCRQASVRRARCARLCVCLFVCVGMLCESCVCGCLS